MGCGELEVERDQKTEIRDQESGVGSHCLEINDLVSVLLKRSEI